MDVSVIIVNWNTGELLRKCLDSLPAALDGFTYEVLVVDNASSDNSVALAEGSIQEFQLYDQAKNLGFAKANNIGIRQAQGDFVVLLNPDTEAKEGSLGTLISFLRQHPRAAAVGPKLLNSDDTPQPSCRRFPSLAVLALYFLKLHRILPKLEVLKAYEMEDFTYQQEAKVDQIMGACMAIPRRAIEKIGMLDEGYWIWFEEVDWCKRASEENEEVWFTPTAEVVHHGGTSFKKVLPVHKEWLFIRSSLRYVYKYSGPVSALLLTLLAPLALAIDMLAFHKWFQRR